MLRISVGRVRVPITSHASKIDDAFIIALSCLYNPAGRINVGRSQSDIRDCQSKTMQVVLDLSHSLPPEATLTMPVPSSQTGTSAGAHSGLTPLLTLH